MLVPLLSGTWMSAAALVRVKRGSTWMNFAPRSLAFITHWKPTGWFSAMLEVAMMTSEFCMSIRFAVIAPRPNVVPKAGTVAEGQTRAWGAWQTIPDVGFTPDGGRI